MAIFHQANTLPAGYLFHSAGMDGATVQEVGNEEEVWDLADLTLQCGRRGDSLKLALAWVYYGPSGFERRIDHAFEMAAYLAGELKRKPHFVLLSDNPPPCLQVCFYYAPGGQLAQDAQTNTRQTRAITAELLKIGFMIDYAPGEKGSFFRVVVNCETERDTVQRLLRCLQDVGSQVYGQLGGNGKAHPKP
jgi:glutamate decarboxylase